MRKIYILLVSDLCTSDFLQNMMCQLRLSFMSDFVVQLERYNSNCIFILHDPYGLAKLIFVLYH